MVRLLVFHGFLITAILATEVVSSAQTLLSRSLKAPSSVSISSKALQHRPSGSCGQETYLGGNVFTACDVFVTDYSNTRVDYNSAAIVALIGSAPLNVKGEDYEQGYGWALNWNVYTGSQPLWPVGMYRSPTPCDSYPSGCMPWANSYLNETCCGDSHGFVYSPGVGSWEAYGAHYKRPNGPLQIYGEGRTGSQAPGHYWNMQAPLVSQYAPSEHTDGANASDLPYIAGSLIGDRDCCNSRGHPLIINHALLIIGTLGTNSNATQWVRPAGGPISNAGACTQNCPPALLVYGDHFRLHATSTLDSRLQSCIRHQTCPQTASIVAALQTYGAFLSDAASQWSLVMANSSVPLNRKMNKAFWNANDIGNLYYVKMTDFDILDRGVMGGLICPGESPPC